MYFDDIIKNDIIHNIDDNIYNNKIDNLMIVIENYNIINRYSVMVIAMPEKKTTIQVTEETRDRLYRLKFRRTYDQFLNELCDMFEESEKMAIAPVPENEL